MISDNSAALYLGYADDGESVEMIMKKFELLEKKLQEIAQKNSTEVTSTNTQNQSSSTIEVRIQYYLSFYCY
jgi:hypothetical protein